MEKEYLKSYHISKYDIEIQNDLFDCRIYWARLISSETESLFTQYTKHTFYEIQYALEGKIGMVIDENQPIYFDRSHFLIIPPDTYHQIADGDTVGARFIMAFSLLPKNDTVRQAFRQLGEITPYRESRAMRPLLSLILKKSYRNDPLCRGIISSLLETFLMEILETVNQSQTPEGSLDEEKEERNLRRVSEIQLFIQQFNGIGLSVSHVAQHFHLSERQLNRILLSVTGKTAKELINHEKLKKIEELTITTSLTLREISELCGFSDEYAMNKFFRRYTKTTLSYFRKNSKKTKAHAD